jgi:hypothetical protein
MTRPYFDVGQCVVCIDAKPNRLGGPRALRCGKIYTIRAIFEEALWSAPGWGVFLEGVQITNPVTGDEWPIDPRRFRPVTDRPTDITMFNKHLIAEPVE